MRKIAAVFIGLLVASLATEASAQYWTPRHYYYHHSYYNGRYPTQRNYYENDIHHGYPGPGVSDPGAR